jgi:hypothetical protein
MDNIQLPGFRTHWIIQIPYYPLSNPKQSITQMQIERKGVTKLTNHHSSSHQTMKFPSFLPSGCLKLFIFQLHSQSKSDLFVPPPYQPPKKDS